MEVFAREAAKHMKTEKDLSDFSLMLTKINVESALNGEIDKHFDYEKHQKSSASKSVMVRCVQKMDNADSQLESGIELF